MELGRFVVGHAEGEEIGVDALAHLVRDVAGRAVERVVDIEEYDRARVFGGVRNVGGHYCSSGGRNASEGDGGEGLTRDQRLEAWDRTWLALLAEERNCRRRADALGPP